MSIKFSILAVSIALMVTVVGLAFAGILWSLEAPQGPSVGGQVVLAISGLSAAGCLWRLWSTRHDHLR